MKNCQKLVAYALIGMMAATTAMAQEPVLFDSLVMADLRTGSNGFTSSNEVRLVDIAIPPGATHFQFGGSQQAASIDQEQWATVDQLPTSYLFPLPMGDTNLFLSAWFTNNVTPGPLYSSCGEIKYTGTAPSACVRVSRPLAISKFPATIYPLAVNEASHGGITTGAISGHPIPLHSMALQWVDGPAADASPDQPWLTITTAGTYQVKLVLANAAGNVATSGVSEIVVSENDEPVFNLTGSNRANMGLNSFTGISNLTFSAWIRSTTVPSKSNNGRLGAIGGQGYLGGGNRGFGLYVNGDSDTVSFQIRYKSVVTKTIAAAFHFDGTWRHVAGVRDGTNMKIYVNGVLANSDSCAAGALPPETRFGLGMNEDSNNNWFFPFKGQLSEVRLWNYPRSGEEIVADMGHRLQGDEPGLIGYWPLNEGSGTTAMAQHLTAPDGDINEESWSFDSTLPLVNDDFKVSIGFEFFNLQTGSSNFTSSNEVGVMIVAPPPECNVYQITTGATPEAIQPAAWLSLDAPLANYTFNRPGNDTNLLFYIWYSSTTSNVTLGRGVGNITYTTARPTASIRAPFTRQLDDDREEVLITVDDMDAGSTGGKALGRDLLINDIRLRILPGGELEEAVVANEISLTKPGEYDIELIVRNESGNTATSTPTRVTVIGDGRNYLYFSSTGRYVDLGTGNYGGLGDITISAWIQLKKITDKYNAIAGQAYLYSGIYGYGLFVYDGSLYFQVRLNNAYQLSTPFAAIDEWHHVAGTRSGTRARLYLDGHLMQDMEVSAGAFTTTTRNFGIGAVFRLNWEFFFNGYIADVQLWDYALSGPAIRDLMHKRLKGGDIGLRGYWPLNESYGDYAYDYSGGSVNGLIVNALRFADSSLTPLMPYRAGFKTARPVTLRDPVSGSLVFTDSVTPEVAATAHPAEYSHFQITATGTTNAVNAENWQPLDNFPATLTFTRPPADTNLVRFIWYTNLNEAVVLRRSMADIIYTEMPPQMPVSNNYQRLVIPGGLPALHPSEIDAGIHGGTVFGEQIPLKPGIKIIMRVGETTTEPSESVTLPGSGNWQVALVAENILGHVATSAFCQVEVAVWSGESFHWSGAADGDWHNPRNWNLLGIPPPGATVTIDANTTITLDRSPPYLNGFTLNNGTLLFAGGNATLHAGDIALNNGTVTHQPNSATEPQENGIWPVDGRIHLMGNNITIGSGAQVDANGLGYQGGREADGRGPGGGLHGINSKNDSGGGGGHGGHGGQYAGRGGGGDTYGDLKRPLLPGSGGGGRIGINGYSGGSGGGVVLIEAANRLTVDGVVRANGGAGANTYVGGGAGGSIWLNARMLDGNGSLTANGGAGGSMAGAGGGGRIAIWRAADAHGMAITTAANAGSGSQQTGLGNGTIFWRKIKGTLLILR